MANVVTDAELELIEEAKQMRKAMAEREAKAKAYIKNRQKIKTNYNLIIMVLLVVGTLGILYSEGKI